MWTSRPVLSGCRILVTANRRAEDLAAALAQRGAEVVRTPTLAAVPADRQALMRATDVLVRCPPDLVVVTSAAAVEHWEAAAVESGRGADVLGVLAGARIVARGPKARAALERRGLGVDWVGEAETSRDVLDFLRGEGLDGVRVAVLRSGSADRTFEGGLVSAGAEVVTVLPYTWVGLDRRPEVLAGVDEAVGGRIDAALFTSAPGAEAWAAAVRRRRGLDAVRRRVEAGQLLLAAVGPVTAEPLAYAGLLAAVPRTSRLADLVRLVLDRLGDERHALRTAHGMLRVRAGGITLDHRVVALSPSGVALLRRLAASPGHVVSRDELLRVLPGGSTDPHVAEVAVARLRTALRDATGGARGEEGLVRTVVRRGYVLAAR